jgi:hypothetical protein
MLRGKTTSNNRVLVGLRMQTEESEGEKKICGEEK